MVLFHNYMNKKVKQSTYQGMEDVDRSCVNAVIMIEIIFAVSAYIIYPAGILDVPVAELGPVHFLRLTGAIILGVLTILIFIDVLGVFIKR